MTLSRIISDIAWWWRRKHPPLTRNAAWRKAHDAETIARRRNCTRDIGKARRAKRDAVMRELGRA
jgi:hypothetical protein